MQGVGNPEILRISLRKPPLGRLSPRVWPLVGSSWCGPPFGMCLDGGSAETVAIRPPGLRHGARARSRPSSETGPGTSKRIVFSRKGIFHSFPCIASISAYCRRRGAANAVAPLTRRCCGAGYAMAPLTRRSRGAASAVAPLTWWC